MILVKVNGAPIFLTDLRDIVEERLPLLRQQFPEAEIQAQLPMLRQQLLAGLIDEKMMLQRAERMGITADANEVDRSIQRLREANNLQADEAFNAALQSMNLTPEQLREQMRVQIRQQRLVFEEVQRGIFVSEAEITRYYEENPNEFSAPEQVRLEQLVFLFQGSDPVTAERQAEEALAALREGADLQEVASRYPTALAFPADETFVALADLNESLAEAVPSMPQGTFSEPVQSNFGFHLVKLVDRQAQEVLVLEDVRDQIRDRLTAQKSQERMADYLGRLRDDTYLEVLDPTYADIEEAWKAAGEEGESPAQQP